MAGAALAGCVKNEPIAKDDGSPERITFDAPVVSVSTRATEIFGSYPGDKDFAVWALYHPMEYNANSAYSVYMTNVRCIADDVTNPTKWAPDTDYYWPKNGYLTFAAYAPSEVTATWNENGFTFTDFEVKDTPDDQIDLLYSDRQYDKHSTDMVTDTPYDGVTIPFKHTLSSIVFKVQTTGVSSNATVIKLTGITVTNVVKKGTFAQNLTANREGDSNKPTWDIDAANQDNVEDFYTVFSSTDGQLITSEEAFVNGAVDGENEKYGTANPPATPNTIEANNDGKRRNDLIVIPQNLDRDGDDDVSVFIEYTIQNGDEAAVPQGHTFKLAVENQGAGLTNTWEMGKRYIYHIVIGLDKIYFNPQVTNWEEVIDDVIAIN